MEKRQKRQSIQFTRWEKSSLQRSKESESSFWSSSWTKNAILFSLPFIRLSCREFNLSKSRYSIIRNRSVDWTDNKESKICKDFTDVFWDILSLLVVSSTSRWVLYTSSVIYSRMDMHFLLRLYNQVSGHKKTQEVLWEEESNYPSDWQPSVREKMKEE